MPNALITGVTGQDGSLLAELLVEKGYDVYGLVRPERARAAERDLPADSITVLSGDLANADELRAALEEAQPDEVYNCAGITTLAAAAADPGHTHLVNGVAPLVMLDALAGMGARSVRFCQASSSQVFGPPDGRPRDENTVAAPHNDYARAKAFADDGIRVRRRVRGDFACSAILFNHESPRRSPAFVTRTVSLGVARIKAGLDTELRLRSLAAARDWGYAGDYVAAMWTMLQQEAARDFVIASGQCRTVRELVEVAFDVVGLRDWERYVRVDEGNHLEACSPGDATLARSDLGWSPRVSFKQMIEMMVEHDVANISR